MTNCQRDVKSCEGANVQGVCANGGKPVGGSYLFCSALRFFVNFTRIWARARQMSVRQRNL